MPSKENCWGDCVSNYWTSSFAGQPGVEPPASPATAQEPRRLLNNVLALAAVCCHENHNGNPAKPTDRQADAQSKSRADG